MGLSLNSEIRKILQNNQKIFGTFSKHIICKPNTIGATELTEMFEKFEEVEGVSK